jgi:hypothetical protein
MNSSSIPILQVDAFTDRPFAGNPAAVCLLEREQDAAWVTKAWRGTAQRPSKDGEFVDAILMYRFITSPS